MLTSAQAEVRIVPTMRGFQQRVSAGVKATKVDPLQIQVNLDRKSLAAAESEARAASQRIGKARDVEARASENVRLAEQRLTDARKTQTAGSAQVIAAENRLSQARRASVAAASSVQRSAVDEVNSKNRVVEANRKLEQSSTRLASAGNRARLSFSNMNVGSVQTVERGLSRAAGSAMKLATVSAVAASALVGIGGAAGPVMAVGAALIAAAGAAALIPAAIMAAGAAFATLKIGMSGISDAFKAQSAASTSAATDGAKSAAAQATQQKSIRDALQGVDKASSSAARTRIDGEKRVSDAVESSKETQVSGSRAIASAQADVSSAKQRAADAEQEYRNAVKEATLAIRDQKVELKSSSLSVDEAQLSLDQAIERQKKLKAEGASGLDMREADLGIRRATISLEEAKNRYTDVSRESVRASLYGVQGADNVKDAQRGVLEANSGVRDAETNLAQVRSDAARDNTKAQADIKAAQSDAAQANSDAAAQVRDAQERLADAYAKTGDSASAASTKANEAMANLSPNAQAFVRSVLGMKGAWDQLKNSVQDRLFAGLAGEVSLLGGTYLPILQTGLTGIAGGFNTAALETSQYLRSALGISQVTTTLDNTSIATGQLSRAAAPLTSAFLGISAIGSAFLPGLASGFADAAERAAAFVNSAAGAEKIRGWIAGGLEAIRQIGALLGNLGSIIFTIFSTANQVGGSTIQMVNNLVGAFANWLKSAEGQHVLITIFTTLRDTVNALKPGVQAIGGALVHMITTIGPLLPGLGEGFSAVVIALRPMVDWLIDLVANIIPILSAWMKNSPGSFIAVAGAIGIMVLALKGWAAIQKGTIAGMILQVLWMGIVKIATLAWQAVQWLLNMAMLASPITWIAILLVALVAGVIYAYTHFEWFRNIVQGVWAFLKTFGGWIATAFTATFSFLGNFFSTTWNFIKNTAVTVWNAISGFFVGAWAQLSANWTNNWNAIGNFFVGIWNWIKNTAVTVWGAISAFFVGAFNGFRNFFVTVFTAIGNFFVGIWNWIRNTAVTVWNAISIWFTTALNQFVAGWKNIWNGIGNFFVTVWNWIRNVVTTVWNAIVAWFTTALNNFVTFFKNIWNGIVSFFSGIWGSLKNTVVNLWNQIWGFISKAIEGFAGWFTRSWDGIVNGFQRVWEKIRNIAKAPIRWVLDTVWNKGVGGMWEKAKSFLGLGGFPYADIGLFDRMATGGAVRGAGTGTSDSIPTLLSNGEHVLTAKEVKAAGGHGGVYRMREAIRSGAVLENDSMLPPLRRALGGPVGWNELWGAVRGQFPQARLTDAQSNRPGMHGEGKAIDIAGPRSMDMGFMLNVNRWIAGAFPDSKQLIHTQPGAVNLFNGRPHTYDAPTREGHRNHVHWGRGGTWERGTGNFANVWGDIMSMVDQVKGAISGPAQWLRDQIGSFAGGGAGMFGTVPGAVGEWGISKVTDWLVGKAETMDAAGGGDSFINAPGAGVERWRDLVLRALAFKRQPASLANTVLRRMNQESGGNPNAVNNWDSNARKGTPSGGLLQTIKPTFLANHEPGTSFNMFDPWANILASMNYAMKRYGSLPAAYNKKGGYATGGVIPGMWSGKDDTMVLAQSGERVLTQRQNIAFEALAGVSNRGVSPTVQSVMRGRDLAGVGVRGESPRSVTGIHTDQMVIRESVDMDQALARAAFAASSI